MAERTPARVLVDAFGGIHPASRAINEVLREEGKTPIHYSTVSKWLARGNVPHRWHRPAIDAAARIGVTLTFEDLMYREG